MSKKIKQDYEEQKRQAAENNSINQLETFHAESMTMEAHKGTHYSDEDNGFHGLSF
jgi:hypothetical protein